MKNLLEDCHAGLDQAQEIFGVWAISHFLAGDWTDTLRLARRQSSSCTSNCLNWFRHVLMPVQCQMGHQ
jgi:cellobiose phosphorylase